MTYIAGIVTFNPELARLRENLDAIVDQVDLVRVVDNSSANISDIRELIGEYPTVEVLESPGNRGMSVALNTVMTAAEAIGAQWALLLDQDSVCSSNMIEVLTGRATDGVAIACPNIVDRNVRAGSDPAGPVVYEVDACITSGSLCRVAAWSEIGGYDEEMFVDYVDFEFCLRLRMAGYTIVRDTTATILHEFGAGQMHGRFTAYNYSSVRLYSMARDIIHYAVKHRRSPKSLKVYGYGVIGHLRGLGGRAGTIVLFEDDKARKVRAVALGTVDALTRRRTRRTVKT